MYHTYHIMTIPRTLNEEELRKIKFDRHEFERLGLTSKSLENFIILDGTISTSQFYQPMFLHDIKYSFHNSYSHIQHTKYTIGYGTIPFHFFRDSDTNIRTEINPYLEYNILSVRSLQNMYIFIDVRNFYLRDYRNVVVAKIYSIGSQLCILATSIQRYYIYYYHNYCGSYWIWPSPLLLEIRPIDIRHLFRGIDIDHIKKLINSREIKGFVLPYPKTCFISTDTRRQFTDVDHTIQDDTEEICDEDWTNVSSVDSQIKHLSEIFSDVTI